MLQRITGGGRRAGRRGAAPTDAVDTVDAAVPAVERVPAVLARAVRAVAADGVRPVTDARWVTERLAAFQDHRLSGELRTVMDREPPLVFRARAGQWDASLTYRPAAQLYWRPTAGADAAPAAGRGRSEQPSDTGSQMDARPRRRQGRAEPSAGAPVDSAAGTPADASRALRSGRHVPHALAATPSETAHPTPQGQPDAPGRRLPRWLRAALTSASVPSHRSPARPAHATEHLPLTPRHEPRTPDRTTADDPAGSERDGLKATPNPAHASADANPSGTDPQPPTRTPAQHLPLPATAARHSAATANARPQQQPDTTTAAPRTAATTPSEVRPNPAHAAVDTRRPATRPPTGAPTTRPRNVPADVDAASDHGPAYDAATPSAAAPPHATTGAAAAVTAEPTQPSARPMAPRSAAVSTELPAAQSSHTGPPVQGTTDGQAVPALAKAVRAAASHSGHGAPLRTRSLEHSEAHGLPLAHRPTGARTAAAEEKASGSENAGVTTTKAVRATGTDVPVRTPDRAALHRQNTAASAVGPSPDARPVSEPESAQAGTPTGADTRSPVRRRNRLTEANAAGANANPSSAAPAAARTTAPNPDSEGHSLPLARQPATTQGRGAVGTATADRQTPVEEHSDAITAGPGREADAQAPGPAAPLHVQTPDRPSLDGLPLAERAPSMRPDTRSARPADGGNRPAGGPEAAAPTQTSTQTSTRTPDMASAPTDGTNTGSSPAPQSAGTHARAVDDRPTTHERGRTAGIKTAHPGGTLDPRAQPNTRTTIEAHAVQGTDAPSPGPSAPLRARNPGHPVVPDLPLAPRAAAAADEAVPANAPAFGRPDAPAERTGPDQPQPATTAVEGVVHRAAKADARLPHASADNALPSPSGTRSPAAAYGDTTEALREPHAPYPAAPAPVNVTGPSYADTRVRSRRPDLTRPGTLEDTDAVAPDPPLSSPADRATGAATRDAEPEQPRPASGAGRGRGTQRPEAGMVRAPATGLRGAAARRPSVGRLAPTPRPGRRPDDPSGSYGALGTELPGGSAPFTRPDPAPVGDGTGTGTGAYPVFRAFGTRSPAVRAPAPSGEPARADVAASVVWGIPPVLLDKEKGA